MGFTWRSLLLPPGRKGMLLAAMVLALLGFVDWITGHDFTLAAFYIVPISWACWTGGRRAGLAFATLSGGVWLVADLLTDHVYPYAMTPYWNAFTMLLLFMVLVYLISAVQSNNQHLEAVVQQRTAALRAEIAERQRLEQATLQAERLAVIGTIAAQVAHEIRNPLGSITLNLDLISKEVERLAQTSGHSALESRALVAEMRGEVRRLQGVVEDYLRFARLPKMQRKPLILNGLLEEKLAFMGAMFENAGIGLRTEYDADLKPILADAEQVWQAVLNLVLNSLEALPAGGTLTISTRNENRRVVLRVADNGKGMTGEQLDQLFAPFFTTKTRGTGLGLLLTQQILNEHGAEIQCASDLGKQTTFTISFPTDETS